MQFTKTILLTFIIGILQAHCGMTVPMTGTSRSSSTPADCCIDFASVDGSSAYQRRKTVRSKNLCISSAFHKDGAYKIEGGCRVVRGEYTEAVNGKVDETHRCQSTSNEANDPMDYKLESTIKNCKECMGKSLKNVGECLVKADHSFNRINDEAIYYAKRFGRFIGKSARIPIYALTRVCVQAVHGVGTLVCIPVVCCCHAVDGLVDSENN